MLKMKGRNHFAFSVFLRWMGIACILGCLSGAADVFGASSTGWYIRGGAGAVWGRDADFSDKDCSASSPPALFGCGAGIDGRSLGAYGDFGEYLGVEIATGCHVRPWLRMDLCLLYRPNMKYSGTANFLSVPGEQPVSGTAVSAGLMLNGFVELGQVLGFSKKSWQPYVGAGIGLSRNALERVKYRFPEAATHKESITPSGRRIDPAFMIACGVGIQVRPQWMLDVSLRYEDLGAVETEDGPMYMDHVSKDIEISGTSADLRGLGAMAGVRYNF